MAQEHFVKSLRKCSKRTRERYTEDMEWTKERRLLRLKVAENMKTWAGDAGSTYLSNPAKERDPVKMGVGAVMAGASLVFEAPDYLWAGVANDSLEAPTGSRTMRDLKGIATNHVRHPIRTVLSGLRLLSDVPMDGVDALFGFRHGTRSKVSNLFN